MRLAVIGLGFFLFPLIHPVFAGMGLAWLAYLALRTFATRKGWSQMWVAAAGTVAGWSAFYGYYLSRPALYARFLMHAHLNVETTRQAAPPGIRTFLRILFTIDPTKAATLVYLLAIGSALWLGYSLWKCRGEWRAWLERENMVVFAAIGFLSNLLLCQFSYNIVYWGCAWPFAVVLACWVFERLLQAFPARRGVILGALITLLVLHGAYLPVRTYLWYKTGFVDLRSRLREFASGLPPAGRLFVPEVMWDTYAGSAGAGRQVYMNTLPYLAGDPAEERYAQFITPLMQSGDVLVIDKLQAKATLIDPNEPEWKVIGRCKVTYQGEVVRGYDLIAYQKE